MRLIRALASGGVVWLALVTGEWAQNGLGRFEKEIKPRIQLDKFVYGGRDGAAKVFTLNKLEVALRGQGKLGLALVLDGVSEKSSEMAGTKDDGRLRTAQVTLDDSGLLAKLLPPLAKEQGQSAEGMVA